MNKNKWPILALLALLVFFSGCQSENNQTVEEHYKKAQTYILGKYPSAATIELKKALDLAPDHIKSLVLLNKIHSDPERLGTLLPYLKKAYQAGVRNYKIIYLLAEAHYDQHEYKKTLALIQHQVKLISDPLKLMELRFLQAKTYIRLEKFSIAEKIYTRLLRSNKFRYKALLGLAQLSLDKVKKDLPYHPAYMNLRLVGKQYLLKEQVRSENLTLDNDLYEELQTRKKSLFQLLNKFPDNFSINLITAKTLYHLGEYSLSSKLANHALSLEQKSQQSLFLLAKINIRLKYYEAAIHNLKQLLASHSEDLLASNTLGALYIQRGDIKSAEILLEYFIKSGVEDEDLFLNMGVLEILKNKIDKASIYFKYATKLFPNSAYVQAQLATVYLNKQQVQEALTGFESAYENDQENLELGLPLVQVNLIAGRIDHALRLARSLAAKHEKSAAPVYLLGLIYELQNNHQRALSYFQEALTIDPEYYLTRIKISQNLIKQNKITLAEITLRQGLKYESGQINLSAEIALIEAQQGYYQKAVDRLEKIRLQNPDSILASVALGNLYLQLNHINKAIKIKKQIDKVENKSIDILLFLAKFYQRLENTSGVVDMYTQAYQRSPSNPEYQLLLSQAYTEQGDYKRAKNLLNNLLGIFGDQYQPALINLAKIELKQNNLTTSSQIIKRLLQIDANHSESLVLYADLLNKKQQPKKAVQIYAKHLKNYPEPKVINLLSNTLQNIGKKKTAERLLRKWSTLDPSDLDISLSYIDFLHKNGLDKAAVKEASRFLKLQENNILILNKLALIYSKIDPAKAWNFAKTAYSISQDSPSVLSTYGRMCITRGLYREGLNVLSRMNHLAPGIASYQYHYAYGLNQAGKNKLAEKLLKSSLLNDNDFVERKQAKQLLDELSTGFL